MLIIANDNVTFGLKNHRKAARNVLKNVNSQKRQQIYNEIEKFCQITQKRGIKGIFKLEGLNEFSIIPIESNEKTTYKVSSLSADSFISAMDLKTIKHSKPFGTENAWFRRVNN